MDKTYKYIYIYVVHCIIAAVTYRVNYDSLVISIGFFLHHNFYAYEWPT